LNREFCWKCGAKLFVPSGAGAQSLGFPMMDEHVLERISAVEYSLNTLHKRIDAIMDTLERLAASNFIDHTMIETLTDTLEGAGLDLSNLEESWRRRIDSRIQESDDVDRLSNRVERILSAFSGDNRAQFAVWIEKAHNLLMAERTSESLQFLEPALEHDPGNMELGLMIAEVYFQTRDDGRAIHCLKEILSTQQDHFLATFLYALILQRQGKFLQARLHLERAIGLKKDSPAAHASLGSLLTTSGDRELGVRHLTTALKLKPSAAVHYLLSSLYYDSGEHRRAVRHLRQATELDPGYGEAHYQLGLLCLEMNWLRKAQECFRTAQTLNPREKRYRRRLRSFSGRGTGPDQLHKLIREELPLVNSGSSSGHHKRDRKDR
jgi:tetratricopeptide (TPR) repeat protein